MLAPRLGLALGIGIIAAGAFGVTAASAQYAAPLGLCTITAPSASVNANSSLTYTIAATLTDGKPAPNVAGTVRIGDQPGGSTLGSSTFTTDASGKATFTVQTGGNAGMLQVNGTVGTLNCAAVSSIVAQKTNPDVIKPPATGFGQAESNSSSFPLAPAALAGAIALMGAGGAAYAVSRRRG